MPDPHCSSLVIFCKRPILGQGKQRLAKTIGAERALQVAQCLLDCTMEDAHTWQQNTGGNVVISPASQADREWARELQQQWLQQPATIVPQPQGNLGQRLQQVDQLLRQAGHDYLIFIGTDAPQLSVADLLTANQSLAGNDVVLQPASDGGVTLMAARRQWPALQDLPWSSDNLQQALSAVCLAEGCSVWLLPGSQDVDEWSELSNLLPLLADDPRPARQALVSYVSEHLADIKAT